MLGFQRKHFLLDTKSESWIFIHYKKSKADSCLHRQLHPVHFSMCRFARVPQKMDLNSCNKQPKQCKVCLSSTEMHNSAVSLPQLQMLTWKIFFVIIYLFIFLCESRSSEGANIHLLLHSELWWPFSSFPSLPSHNLACLIQIITHERAGGLASYSIM